MNSEMKLDSITQQVRSWKRKGGRQLGVERKRKTKSWRSETKRWRCPRRQMDRVTQIARDIERHMRRRVERSRGRERHIQSPTPFVQEKHSHTPSQLHITITETDVVYSDKHKRREGPLAWVSSTHSFRCSNDNCFLSHTHTNNIHHVSRPTPRVTSHTPSCTHVTSLTPLRHNCAQLHRSAMVSVGGTIRP